jgi:hypothetical protein
MSRIDSWLRKISTGRHFQNGRHNTAQIQHCLISTHIWNGVEIEQCWICAVLWWPFWKWRPVEIFQSRESIRDIIIYPHITFWWYRTMLNFWCIVAAFWKRRWDDDEVRFVPDQHADLYGVISLKQQSADRHVAPLGHIILIPQHNWTDNTMSKKHVYLRTVVLMR